CIGSDWTLGDVNLPYTSQFDQVSPTDDPAALIPVERIAGPILLVCAEADEVWMSCPYAQAIERRLTEHAVPNRHLLIRVPGAGHAVGGLTPYQPNTRTRADALGEAQAWPRLLSFLDGLR